LILVAAEVHDAADRRVCRGRKLDEGETLLTRDRERLRRGHDAERPSPLPSPPAFPNPGGFLAPPPGIPPRAVVENDKGLPNKNPVCILNWRPRGRRRFHPSRRFLPAPPE